MKIKVNIFYFIFLVIFIYLTIFYFNQNQFVVLGQSGDNNIKLEVYPNANYQGLGSLIIQVGITSNIQGNDFNRLYNISPYVTALDKSFYKLTIPATTGINLTFRRVTPTPITRSLNNSCTFLGGVIEGSNCVIYGMLNKTTNGEYEHWQISASSSNISLGQINFYLVSSSTAQNVSNRNDQYYLIPEATTVELTNDRPSATITYQVYYKKIYCPINLADGQATITPNSRGFGVFANIRGNNYGDNIFVTRSLNIDNPASGTYRLSLLKLNDPNNNRISNIATITVNNNITPPTLSLSCTAAPTSGLRINSSTVYTLTASSSQQLGSATFTLLIATSGGGYLQFNTSTYFSGLIGSVITSVTWTASGTYNATATVETLYATTSARCPSVNVESCRCLYRQQTGGFERRCRQNGGWSEWRPYGGTIDQNCACWNPSVRINYPECNN